jgi:hypothetical protein
MTNETRECGNEACGWKGTTKRMLGAIGPLCPECGETTEPVAARPIGEIRLDARSHPFARLLTAYDENGNGWVEGTKIYAAPAPASAITPREADLIRRILNQCDHAGINGMRLAPRFGQKEGIVAVPETNIDAAIEGWKREHKIIVDGGVN